jgi:hypothetical protein
MGMVVGLASVSDATIERLLADPPLVWKVIAPDDVEIYERSRREADGRNGPSLFARLFRARTRADEGPKREPSPLVLRDGEGDLGDLDKSWHGIHYLLTGSADEGEPPLDFLVGGGTPVGDEDVGYGAPRVFTAAETRAISAALAAVSDDELRRRFSPLAMMRANIYPEIWDRDPSEDDTLGYLMEHVRLLRDVIATVVGNDHGLLVYLT